MGDAHPIFFTGCSGSRRRSRGLDGRLLGTSLAVASLEDLPFSRALVASSHGTFSPSRSFKSRYLWSGQVAGRSQPPVLVNSDYLNVPAIKRPRQFAKID